ncbi:hypothetical protein [Tenacibaculum sp. nBUS_03]|uniref:hypothetical protein n=1 Tax=Tenacibaculum sp. nBUS_03 TaxID=3395320 RepID=UPI003EBB1777
MSDNSIKEEKIKKIKVKFLLSPTGLFKLSYNIGNIVDLPESLALELIETKYAEKVE